MFHDACDQRQGTATAIVNETRDLNKMVYCFNCSGRIFVNETFWDDPIHYDPHTEIKTIKEHINKDGREDLPNIFQISQKWIVIDAPTGTGKTTAIGNLLLQTPNVKVLAIAKFTSLVRNLAERWNLVVYKCNSGENQYNTPGDKYACSLDHVITLVQNGRPLVKWDILLLDEAAMTRGHSTASTIKDR